MRKRIHTYKRTKCPDSFQSKNGRMVMYVCDLFDLTEDIIGPVDFVLDRGSLEAVYEADREAYLGLMKATKPTR